MQQKRIPRRALLAPLALCAMLNLAGAPAVAQVQSTAAVSPREGAAAQAAAQRDLAQFAAYQISTRPGVAPPEFPLDVSDMQDLKDAVIAYGFAEYSIAPKDLSAGRGELRTMARPTGQWRFVISLRGKPIGLATVEMVNGRYETVSYGAAVLAKDVDAMTNYHGNATRSNLRLLRIYQARSDFLEVSGENDNRARYAPLHSARESLLPQARAIKDGKPAALLESEDLLQPLRTAVKANLDAFR
jgi:hypothetical protein